MFLKCAEAYKNLTLVRHLLLFCQVREMDLFSVLIMDHNQG